MNRVETEMALRRAIFQAVSSLPKGSQRDVFVAAIVDVVNEVLPPPLPPRVTVLVDCGDGRVRVRIAPRTSRGNMGDPGEVISLASRRRR